MVNGAGVRLSCSDIFGLFGFLSVIVTAFCGEFTAGAAGGYFLFIIILGFLWIHLLARRVGDHAKLA